MIFTSSDFQLFCKYFTVLFFIFFSGCMNSPTKSILTLNEKIISRDGVVYVTEKGKQTKSKLDIEIYKGSTTGTTSLVLTGSLGTVVARSILMEKKGLFVFPQKKECVFFGTNEAALEELGGLVLHKGIVELLLDEQLNEISKIKCSSGSSICDDEINKIQIKKTLVNNKSTFEFESKLVHLKLVFSDNSTLVEQRKSLFLLDCPTSFKKKYLNLN